MPDALIEAKLSPPRRRDDLVPRPRLVERLNRWDRSRITLISAPAGFGKTTLITQWLSSQDGGRPTAWLSLDEQDNDPMAFWTYLIAALRTALPGVGEAARSLLDIPQAPIERVLTSLSNEMTSSGPDVALVLDDFHVIEAPGIHRGMAFLVEHLPQRVHLIITTRADPALPLARLRARGELTEIRAADLRFTIDEAAAYLGGTMGIVVSDRDVQALERRTEGWIAALQLAGLSMQGRDDPAGFVAGFSGDDRYIVDYLVEEVLSRQPEAVRRFLLETSILARLTGPLCDAVSGGRDGGATLDRLDRANLFVIPLDDRRWWYRYHHLFADVLRTHLAEERPDEVPGLHERASEWFAREGDLPEAIRHAITGGNLTRAADLIEQAIPDMRKARKERTLQAWLEALPRAMLEVRPVLGLTYAGTLIQTGSLAGVDELLLALERWSERQPDEATTAGRSQLRRVPVELAMYRAAQALMVGDVPATSSHAQRVLDLSDPEDHLSRGAGAALLGLAHWSDGDLTTAEHRYAEATASLIRAGFVSDALGSLVTLADVQVAQARLEDAQRTYERGLALASSPTGQPHLGAVDMHVGMGELARERNDLVQAAAHLSHAAELGDELGLPQNAYRSRLLAARIRQAEGDLNGAVAGVTEAERWRTSEMSPDVRPLAAVKARLWVARGALPEAWAWARERRLSIDDHPTYMREFELATLARLLVAQGARDRADSPIDDAIMLAQRLVAAAEDGRRDGSMLDILVVLAMARHARRDMAGGLAELTRALALAEPHGHARIFLDEGAPMTALLRVAAKRQGAAPTARRLLAAAVDRGVATPSHQPLIEPLSERELDVLRLLATDLEGPDIARQLFVSPNTMRTHTRNIYAKLGVNSRRAAVLRATELELLRSATR